MNLEPTPDYVDVRSGVIVVRMSDQMIDHVINERVKFELHFMIEEADDAKMVLDFSDLNVVNSSIIGVIMSLSLKMRRCGGHLRLCGMTAMVQEVFALTQLNKILDVDATCDDALAAIQANGG